MPCEAATLAYYTGSQVDWRSAPPTSAPTGASLATKEEPTEPTQAAHLEHIALVTRKGCT